MSKNSAVPKRLLPSYPCLNCGVEGYVYDDGEHMNCEDCGSAWLTESYLPRMAEKLGDVDREPTYFEKIRQLTET